MLQAFASPVFRLPRVPRTVISRPRLSQLIASLLEDHDLVVVRGPAGTGKTVALADWASSGITAGHVSWVTLDQPYADRTSFWREMILGTTRRVDESLHPMILECAEALTAGADPRTVLRRFVPYIPETIMVIDRLDFITDEALLKDMAWVLQNSLSIKAIITARSRSLLESPAMTKVMDVAKVGPNPFHLTAEETSALVTLRGLDLDAEELHAATGGHPLLTRATMAVHDAAGTSSIAASVENAISEFLSLSLAESRLGPGVQDFMVRTSIPESFTVALASRLSGVGDPITIRATDENRHVIDRAHDSVAGTSLFKQLKAVKWTRNTGGVIMTNNEYASEEGRGDTCSTAFGPIGAAQEPSSCQEYTDSKGHRVTRADLSKLQSELWEAQRKLQNRMAKLTAAAGRGKTTAASNRGSFASYTHAEPTIQL